MTYHIATSCHVTYLEVTTWVATNGGQKPAPERFEKNDTSLRTTADGIK
jgi:hypothetical protein